MGYHLKEIPKGEFGAFSKIKEEFLELEDAVEQRDPIMALVEMSDMIGAIEEYIKRWNMNLKDLKDFSDKTKSAFKDGTRE
jgi:hypothetical protein